MSHQLYLWGPTRHQILEKHDFYVAQVSKRIFPQFAHIEREAEEFAESEFQRLGSRYGDGDLADAADEARERAQELYGQLHDMSEMMRQGALAGCYHQWDKNLREFLERDLGRGPDNHNRKLIWSADLDSVVDLLGEFGWDVKGEPFYPLLKATHLIVNVYKHGKGRSLEELAVEFPQYVRSPLGNLAPSWAAILTYEWLKVSEADFRELAYALRSFWEQFPERLALVR